MRHSILLTATSLLLMALPPLPTFDGRVDRDAGHAVRILAQPWAPALAPGRPNGIEGTREFLSSPGRRAHAGRWVDLVTIAEGDYVVEYGVRAGNWPSGFRGFDVPGGLYERDVAFMYRLEDGRIAERWAVRDDLGLMLQLGGLSPQPPTDR